MFGRPRSHPSKNSQISGIRIVNGLLMVERGEHDAPTQFNVILNWFEELEHLVPTKE
jgi:hypothetical protein